MWPPETTRVWRIGVSQQDEVRQPTCVQSVVGTAMVVPSLPRQEPPPNQRHVRPAPWSHGLPNNNTGPDRPIHKRKSKKSAYQLQREERDELLRVADELDAQLEALRLRAGFRTRRYHEEMDACQALKDALKANVYENERYLIRLDSLLTAELLLPVINPNATFIHLPKDMDKRRQVLRGLETVKLRRGIETVIDRLGHFDEFLPYKCEDWLTTESGECHFYRADIVQFRNFQTARQLYDTFVQFLHNMEINLTEMLGHLTLREDVEEIAEPTIWNHRFVTYSSELPTELNLVGFAQFYDYSPITSSPVGMILCDTVNVDDLYPYKPQERACKDAQSFNLVYEACDPVTKDVVVILKQITFIVQLRPQFAFSHSEWKKLLANIPRWPNAIHKYLREYVVPLKPHDSSVRQ